MRAWKALRQWAMALCCASLSPLCSCKAPVPLPLWSRLHFWGTKRQNSRLLGAWSPVSFLFSLQASTDMWPLVITVLTSFLVWGWMTYLEDRIQSYSIFLSFFFFFFFINIYWRFTFYALQRPQTRLPLSSISWWWVWLLRYVQVNTKSIEVQQKVNRI